MTIDEAINHAEEIAIEQDKICKRYDDASGYTRSHNEKIRTTDAIKCEKCAEEHRQLAEWLKELKQLKEKKRWIPCSERLPEKHGGYLVTAKEGYVSTALWVGSNEYWKNVIAWMPLPEVYKLESEEKHGKSK